jgi:hypothetical protein
MIVKNVDTTNPETLLIEGHTSKELFTDLSDSDVLAAVRKDTPINIASLLAYHQEEIESQLAQGIVQVLVDKINEATPDQLENIVDEAQAIGRPVWLEVRPHLMKRNNDIAKRVSEATNLAGMELICNSVAKVNGDIKWVPKPVYNAIKENLEARIATANLTQLDDLAQVAHRWRLWTALSDTIKARDAYLLNKASVYQQFSGYVVQNEAKRKLIDSIREAIRMVEDEDSDWNFVEPKAS